MQAGMVSICQPDSGFLAMLSRTLTSYLLCLLCLFGPAPAFAALDDDDIDIDLTINGDAVSMDVTFLVDAKPREVWAVLTDYERMEEFVSNLTSSRILSRKRNGMTVEQKGKASAGP